MKYFASIQFLRFVAATFVIFAHMGIGAHSYKGIDLLFVISGFVIYWTTYRVIGKGGREGLHFFMRRCIRIFTFYWLLFFSLIIFQIYPIAFDLALLKNVFLLPGHKSFLEVTWSLSVELYFYGIFTFCILFLSQKQANIFFILFCWATFLLLGLEWTAYPIKGSPINFFVGQNIWLISCGIITCMCYKKMSHWEPNRYKKWIPIVLCLGVGLFCAVVDYYSNLSFATAGIGSSCIVLGLTLAETDQKLKQFKLWIILGNASYVAYLIHIPIIHYFSSSPELKATNQFLIVGAVWGLSCLLHQYVEQPLLKSLNHWSASLIGRKN